MQAGFDPALSGAKCVALSGQLSQSLTSAISAPRNPPRPRARAQHLHVHGAPCTSYGCNSLPTRRVSSLCIPQRCNLAVPTRSLHRQAARRAHAPRRMCTPPRATRARNGAPSPEPHHRRAAQPSLHTHAAATPVTRRRDAPPRVTAAPRATLVAHARPWLANTSPPPRAQRALHSQYHAQTKNQP